MAMWRWGDGAWLFQGWYDTAAEQAQAWAEQCDSHTETDHPSVRWTSRYGACGQNVLVSTTKKRWLAHTQTHMYACIHTHMSLNSALVSSVTHQSNVPWFKDKTWYVYSTKLR